MSKKRPEYTIENAKAISQIPPEKRTKDEWAIFEWAAKKARKLSGKTFSDKSNAELNRARKLRESIRNIGRIPDVVNPARRESCKYSLSNFIKTYSLTPLNPFSANHLTVIKRIENCVFHGGVFIEAVYRGFGKSTIAEFAIAWITLYGHKRFTPIVCANQPLANVRLGAIKTLLLSDRIAEDFPEVCFPIKCLEGIAQRCKGQMFEDKNGNVRSTNISWSSEEIIFPSTDGVSSGSIIISAGITSSRLRGIKHVTPEGRSLRPDFFLVDDPQDDESAMSKQQVAKRMNILKKAIIKSAVLTESVALVMACTVIQQDDLVDQCLDRKRNPAFQGERIKFVKRWSKAHDTLWLDEYAKIRHEYNDSDPDGHIKARQKATAFYIANRKEMDEGSSVSWDFCFRRNEDEISAIQHAYNYYIDYGEDAFRSEYQNDPAPPIVDNDGNQIIASNIIERCVNVNKYSLPIGTSKITAFIDVQEKCLFYVVVAFRNDFSGHVVDYGCFPDQNLYYFTLNTLKTSLFDVFPGCGQEAAWRKGFETLCNKLCESEYIRDDGASMRISRLLIDANQGQASNTIYDYCKQSKHAGIVMPSRGVGVTASMKPFSDYKRSPGDYVSPHNWRIPSVTGKSNNCRYILSDVNYWKSFTRSRIKTAVGDSGSLTVFGKPENHQMFIEQLCSEYSVTTQGRGRTVDEWKLRQFSYDNHYWDCLVGCHVAASEQGITLGGTVAVGRTANARSRLERLSRLGAVRQ